MGNWTEQIKSRKMGIGRKEEIRRRSNEKGFGKTLNFEGLAQRERRRKGGRNAGSTPSSSEGEETIKEVWTGTEKATEQRPAADIKAARQAGQKEKNSFVENIGGGL